MTTASDEYVLPDLLAPGLVTIFCGSAVGAASARRGYPYAGPGNKFWPMLAETGFTPRRLAPEEYRDLLDFGIGLTDINKIQSGADSDLTKAGDDPGALIAKIERYKPRLVAFAAKRPAQVVVRHAFGRAQVSYGLQEERIGETRLFVMPSPSGLAIRWWDAALWRQAADLHRELGRN